MAGIYRAYGQIRRGSGPWRTPFLIPVAGLEPASLPGTHIAIDTNGADPDLRLALSITRFTSLDDFALKFRIQKIPGRTVQNVTLRIVLLKSSEGILVDQGDFNEKNISFAVLQHRTLPGKNFPNELSIAVSIDDRSIDPSVTDPAAPIAGTAMRTTFTGIAVKSTSDDDLVMAGGLVDGDIKRLTGVETFTVLTLNGWDYQEHQRSIRGIDLAWLDGGAPLPPTATWVDISAANPSTTPSALEVDLYMPKVGAEPTAAPAVTAVAGGAMRPGAYRYRLAYLENNGNESPLGPRSGPIVIPPRTGPPGPSIVASVRVDGIPPLPAGAPPPLATKLRIYRTDPDVPDPAATTPDPEAGDRGDDVLVAELPLTATSFVDTGVDPLASGAPGVIPPDLLLINYRSPLGLDLTGGIRMIDTTVTPASDAVYSGKVLSAPPHLRVAYQPSTAPQLRWSADATVPALDVALPSLATPLGDGVRVNVLGVPARMGLHWSILGSEFFQLAVTAATDLSPAAVGTASIGRVAAQIGPAQPPATWPVGDAAIAVDLTTADAPRPPGFPAVASSLVAMSGLQRAVITSGARPWAERDAAAGRLGIAAQFAPSASFADRDLRVTRRSGGADPIQHLQVTGHLVPDRVNAAAWFPEGAAPRIESDTRLRWLRGEVATLSQPDPPPVTKPPTPAAPPSRIAGRVFLDDTTARLRAEVGDRVRVELASAVRAGGRLDLTTDGAADAARVVVRPDVVVPAAQREGAASTAPSLDLDGLADGATTIKASLPEPGLAGRVAASFGADLPVVVRANPQAKLVTHGALEPTTGLRAASARLAGVLGADVDRRLLTLSAQAPAPGEVPVSARFSPGRPNGSLRVEGQVRERRVAAPADTRATPGVRSWLRARTAHMPSRFTATPAFVPAGKPVDFAFGGLALTSSEPWGPGVVWGEPGSTWERSLTESAFLADLGHDRGIGLITAGFEGIPATIEAWLLAHAGDLGTGRVPEALRLPSVGPVDTTWPPGGALVRLDGPLKLSHVMAALPGDQVRECRTDGGGDPRPVRHGRWTEVIAPFIRLEPSEPGLKRAVLWSAGDAPPSPPPPGTPEPDPCNPPAPGAARKSAIGWDIESTLKASFAVRLYSLNTPSGVIAPRWWSMPTSSEAWQGVADPRCGTWWLDQELQMKDYGGIVALYDAEGLSNPFGDWKAGPGQWWLRIRDGLDDFLGSGDAYMGNVGGGYHFAPSNGIFSTLPRIWNWMYP